MTENTWLARKTAAVPEGRLIVWFGAGVSKASGMPLGYGLTEQWLRHHLPDGEADTILALFADNAELLDKDLPRLEKVIEDARWTFGIDCLKNLELFRLCRPNALHRAIADHIVAHRLYAITTNFDTVVEDCWPGVIPVMTPATGITADWGLIKLHGSLGEDLATLGHSIANLQAGLPPALRERVETLLDNPGNTMVFCGYSGADFFDIVPLFQDRARIERPFAARIVWLHHAVAASVDVQTHGVDDRAWTDDMWEEALSTGALDMLRAFDPARKEGRAGDTRALLAELMPLPELPDPSPGMPWRSGWEKRFRPDADGKALYAAKLYASIGMGARSAAFIDMARLPRNRFDHRHQLLFNALRDQGFYDAERILHRWAMTVDFSDYSRSFHRRQWAAALRLSRRPITAGILYLMILWRFRNERPFADSDRREALWSVVEAGLFAQAIVAGLPPERAVHALLLPLILPLRLMIGASLALFQRHAAGSPEATDPHLLALVTRISSFLADWPGPVVAFLERVIYRRDGLPVLEFHDDTPERYRETDSLLGLVNHGRNHAVQALRAAGWGWLGRQDDDKSGHGWIVEAVSSLKLSYRIAGLIGDPMGRIKALRLLAGIARRCGQHRIAAGRQRLAVELETRQALAARLAHRRAKAWVQCG
ncbi:hypothetical protein VY88_10065 [Azospirillum thiophilum]|uniref:SIR2-like domain-containing protein n=1 Tax=Azospirillum thiophilum TaxID=528244 RepID=A0AAC9EX25_9PROT|nr:hypothetical protein [Azospirillum thiophilum]ALG70001.1 hypothetical protein AL072_02645 [Azospirillum thiophilum]KJR66315.1 hypothetical protein VY88_10065 [Azospirillum thiophilum]